MAYGLGLVMTVLHPSPLSDGSYRAYGGRGERLRRSASRSSSRGYRQLSVVWRPRGLVKYPGG